jgi:aminoglycoside phosphotransferase (APT) family kinase protein
MHADELPVAEELVSRMVAARLPRYAGLGVRRLPASGSSNWLFRLGEELLVRVPRQPGGSATILKEARWLPFLQAALPTAVPEIVDVGEPSHGYPEHWSVVRWLDGEHPAVTSSRSGARDLLAGDLAALVGALRQLGVPEEARTDPALRSYRAEPLAGIDADIREYAEQCRALPGWELDIDEVLAVWDAAMAAGADPPSEAAHWLHGDLLAENLLVREGRLAAVLDFGALAVGDPTVDLVAAWELLGPEARSAFRAGSGVDDHTWLLGRAWALAIAVMTFPYYWESMPERCAARLVMARQVLDDAASH